MSKPQTAPEQAADVSPADIEIEIPEYGMVDPSAISALALRNVLLVSHNAALTLTCRQLQEQVAQLKLQVEVDGERL